MTSSEGCEVPALCTDRALGAFFLTFFSGKRHFSLCIPYLTSIDSAAIGFVDQLATARARSARNAILWCCNAKRSWVDGHRLCCIVCLVDSDQAVCQLKHVVAQGYNDKLSIFGSFLNVVGDNRDILEVQGSIDFIHHIQRSRLEVVQSKH